MAMVKDCIDCGAADETAKALSGRRSSVVSQGNILGIAITESGHLATHHTCELTDVGFAGSSSILHRTAEKCTGSIDFSGKTANPLVLAGNR